mgnify:CR=1 FL=1
MNREEMEKRIGVLRLDLDEYKRENERLRHVLEIKEERHSALSVKRVISYSRELGRELLLVERVPSDGIGVGSIAIDSDGIVVGTVIEQSDRVIKVSIAANQGNVYESLVMPLETKTFAKGIGGRVFSLEMIPRESPIREGDLLYIMISGSTELFPIGRIGRVSPGETGGFKEIKAVMLAEPRYLKEIGILSYTSVSDDSTLSK